jgi:Ni,Fe-hydrogenase III large subunit
MEDIIAIVLLFGGGTLFLLSVSPVGRAIAHRIKGTGSVAPADVMRQLEETQSHVLDELDAMRQELAEVQERLDFTERLLARHREVGQLEDGSGGRG